MTGGSDLVTSPSIDRLSAGKDGDGGGSRCPVHLGVADLRVAGDLTVSGLAPQLDNEFVDLS